LVAQNLYLEGENMIHANHSSLRQRRMRKQSAYLLESWNRACFWRPGSYDQRP